MGTPDKSFSDFVDIVKSWIPRRTEPPNLSRDFWMPDHSCRVCYECDAQFTIFNRRHHCRLCGRVFCAKCTTNSIPVASEDPKTIGEDGERIRVCNFCFKQWEQERVAAEFWMREASPGFSPTLSAASLVSTKCSGTIISSITTGGSFSHPSASYHHVAYDPGLSPCQSMHLEPDLGKSDVLISPKDMDSVVDMKDSSSFLLNNKRSDDDDNYNSCRLNLKVQNFQHSDDYYGQVELDEVNQRYNCSKVLPAEENLYAKEISSPNHVSTESHASLDVTNFLEDAGHGSSYDGDTSAPIYGIEGSDMEPVDFENNGLLWLPPDPVDGEDERKGGSSDDDDEDAVGQWGYLRKSNSSGSGESRRRDQNFEEHKKAMKNIVDGHFRALVTQLLQVGNLPMGEEDDERTWLDIISSLSWEVATFLKPDTSKSGGMDPGGYVKIKCIACGSRSQSVVVKGIVCKKNVSHRRMASNIDRPRLLILGGALEYQRVTNLLSSFDTLLQQEMDHLKMAVARINAHHPDVLLVEKSVSRFAQDYLHAKDISLVLNVKRPLLERIARCTGAQIVPSVDHLSSQNLGSCDSFHVEKFSEDHGGAGQGRKKNLKYLMFFEGCPKPLGCTVLLKGANRDELKKVKHILQYGIFAAYHLAMETSFLADEGASLPELPLTSPISVTLPDKPSRIDRSISTVPGFSVSAFDKPQLNCDTERPNLSRPTSPSGHQTTRMKESPISFESHNSASGFTSPPIDSKGLPVNKSNRAQWVHEEACRASSSSLCDSSTAPQPQTFSHNCASKASCEAGFAGCDEAETLSDIQATANDCSVHFLPDSLEACVSGGITTNSQNESRRIIGKELAYSDVGASHQDSGRYDHSRSMDEAPPSPSNHRSILVSLSTRCVWKGTVCERAHLFRIKYYGNFDKPLGRFLRDHLFDQSHRCRSCEMPSEAHVHCYTHRQGSLTISVRKLPEFVMPGECDGKIWMWHRCLHCPHIDGLPPATQRVVMSDAAWGLSFGKFLELSFSNNAAASRVASCGHSIHRDCLRFYGFGKMVACFRYAPISVHSVYLPPSKLDFTIKLQEWIQKEANEVADRTKLLFTEVHNAVRQIVEKRTKTITSNSNMEVQELQGGIVELQEMFKRQATEFEESLQQTLKKEVEKGQPAIDILEVNKLRRQLLFHSYLWAQRLMYASCTDSSLGEPFSALLPRDKEKVNAVDKPVDLNLVNVPQVSHDTSDAIPSDSRTDDSSKANIDIVPHQEPMFPSNPMFFQQKQDLKLDSFQVNGQNIILSTRKSASDQLDSLDTGVVVRRALSDGHFPIPANLSDTLDAKWRGEAGPLLADARTSDPVVSIDALTSVSAPAYEESEERNTATMVHSFASTVPTKWGDSAEDFLSWVGTPFLNFYRSLNKSSVSAPRFDVLKQYNSIYVSLFQEIEHNGARLLLPVGVNGTVIPIYDDEPTSIISYALVSPSYHSQMSGERERPTEESDVSSSLPLYDSGSFQPFQSLDEVSSQNFRSFGSIDESMPSLSGSRSSLALDPVSSTKALHVKTSFADEGFFGAVKYTVTAYYAKSFDALRQTCCSSEFDFIRSLSRCKKWGAQGGKSNVFFAKSLDDRFIVKQVTKTELESFIKFAPEYFKYLSESIGTGSPTCLAKILGIYQVTSKFLKGGKETRMDVLVMENLFFGRNLTRLYDLKGSSRSRYNPDSSGTNKVLLDQNLIEAMPTSPIFVGNKAKRLLERAVWNDTSFLASIDVMDYSLLVGVDEEKHELVLGIIDFMRQYTWDKHLETWVKASGILGGPKNASPTVISPKQYKKRFRKAMSAYFLMVPDEWWPHNIVPSKMKPEDSADNLHSGVSLDS